MPIRGQVTVLAPPADLAYAMPDAPMLRQLLVAINEGRTGDAENDRTECEHTGEDERKQITSVSHAPSFSGWSSGGERRSDWVDRLLRTCGRVVKRV